MVNVTVCLIILVSVFSTSGFVPVVSLASASSSWWTSCQVPLRSTHIRSAHSCILFHSFSRLIACIPLHFVTHYVSSVAAVPPGGDKILVDLDISGDVPTRVKALPSVRFAGGIHYNIKQASRHTHVIGRVRDGDDVLLNGDERYMSRYVLVVVRDNGCKYARIMTRRREAHKYVTWIDEFIKCTMDGHYSPVVRTPIEVDVLTQQSDHYISVKKTVYGPDANDIVKEFTVQKGVQDDVVIGVVKYGEHIIDETNSGVIERRVTVERDRGRPLVTVFTRHRGGGDVEARYKMITDSNRFHFIDQTKKIVDLCE